jgi:tripartite-type tricarboxylate transporter receptor subunit TctC
LKTLENALNKAARHDAFKGFLKQVFLAPEFKTREEIKSLIEAEYKAWDELIGKVGLKAK